VRAEPEEEGAHDQLGLAYAGQGRVPDAERAVQTAEALWRAHGDTAWLAAADTLLAVLSDSTFPYATPAAVRVDPFWRSLKGVPRFDQLLSGK
jgi:predicted HD phosphohydrolase